MNIHLDIVRISRIEEHEYDQLDRELSKPGSLEYFWPSWVYRLDLDDLDKEDVWQYAKNYFTVFTVGGKRLAFFHIEPLQTLTNATAVRDGVHEAWVNVNGYDFDDSGYYPLNEAMKIPIALHTSLRLEDMEATIDSACFYTEDM